MTSRLFHATYCSVLSTDCPEKQHIGTRLPLQDARPLPQEHSTRWGVGMAQRPVCPQHKHNHSTRWGVGVTQRPICPQHRHEHSTRWGESTSKSSANTLRREHSTQWGGRDYTTTATRLLRRSPRRHLRHRSDRATHERIAKQTHPTTDTASYPTDPSCVLTALQARQQASRTA